MCLREGGGGGVERLTTFFTNREDDEEHQQGTCPLLDEYCHDLCSPHGRRSLTLSLEQSTPASLSNSLADAVALCELCVCVCVCGRGGGERLCLGERGEIDWS